MTIGGSKNQSTLLRIAPDTPQVYQNETPSRVQSE